MALTPIEFDTGVDTAVVTNNGVKYYFQKRNDICIVNIGAGSFTNDVAADEKVCDVPSGYKGAHAVTAIVRTATDVVNRINLAASGTELKAGANFTAGQAPRGTFAYILAD